MKKVLCLLLCASASATALAQANQGELQLRVTDPDGVAARVLVRVVSEGNRYASAITADVQGRAVLQHLPFGLYSVEVQQAGFVALSQTFEIQSSIPIHAAIQLKLSAVQQSVNVSAGQTLLDTGQSGSSNQIGTEDIQNRFSSIPGRSIQDLINSQPGWLYEGNAVLHPRGSEYQTQFVIDGIPLTDDRSPSFGPEIEADDVQSMSIYTAGIPAEYGRKMGGVVEINTQQDSNPGLHGQLTLYGGSFASAGAFARGQYTWGQNTFSASGDGSRTDHYLNPVVPQNYSNTGTLGDFALGYRRQVTPEDKLSLSVRREVSRYDIPNELLQQAAGQRQNADNIETMGVASYQHIYSAFATGELSGMVRDNASDFYSNPASTPVEVSQHNSFREGYFKAGFTFNRGREEWKIGAETDNIFLHENTSYLITGADDDDGEAEPARTNHSRRRRTASPPPKFRPADDEGNPTFSFRDHRPDLEQSIFVQDRIRFNRWTISAGIRWDHYQLLLNDRAIQPRFSIARYFPSANTVVHFSYDRVFQTPSFENILLSSSMQIESIDPGDFLRLPVKPSKGDYYEVGLSALLAKHLKLDANYYRRFVSNYADDDQIDNTSISFPISFRKAVIYGAEGKIAAPEWHRFSGFASYSYMVGNVWNPVTGGIFLGDDADEAASDLSGHFPDSQDQRHSLRTRVRYQIAPRFWLAFGTQYDTGLPFEFGGDGDQALTQYGPAIVDRINFDRGRILPSFQVSASAGLDLYKSERLKMHLQADGENLNDVLDVIDFGGLFSGNAIGPRRNFALRLATTF